MGTLLKQFIYDFRFIYNGEHFPIIHFTTIMVSDIAISSPCEYKGINYKIEKVHWIGST